MYAIVDIAGKQFKVSKEDNILVPKVAAEVGKSVEFDKVLLVSDNGKVLVGQPTLKGATVKAKVLSFERGEKVIVYKKKRRKGFEVKKGHRQDYTKLEIQSIVASMSKK
ncbi:MAG: 50S ribosomal protein L21, partial [Caldithrix sp.]